MDVRPIVTRLEVVRTIAQIVRNRTKVDDPDLHKCPNDPDNPDARGVLDYMAAHTGRHIPPWVLEAEAIYALTLDNRIWWEDQARHSYWAHAAIERGHFYSSVAHAVGLGSRQAIAQRLDRLDGLLYFAGDHLDGVGRRSPAVDDGQDVDVRPRLRADPTVVRERRRIEAAAAAEQEWVTAHRDELAELAKDFVAEADRYGLQAAQDMDDDGERDYIDEFAAQATDGVFTPATVARLGLAATELATAPAVLALDVPRPLAVHKVLERAHRLRAEFAGLGRENAPQRRRSTRNRPRRLEPH